MDANHVTQEWTWKADGKETTTTTFDLQTREVIPALVPTTRDTAVCGSLERTNSAGFK